MKILFVSSYDVADLQNGNGIDYFKLQALQAAGCDVTPVSPIVLSPASRNIVSRGILKFERLFISNLDVVQKKRFLKNERTYLTFSVRDMFHRQCCAFLIGTDLLFCFLF